MSMWSLGFPDLRRSSMWVGTDSRGSQRLGRRYEPTFVWSQACNCQGPGNQAGKLMAMIYD